MQKENEGVLEFSNIFHEKTWSLGIKADRETKKNQQQWRLVKEHVNKKKNPAMKTRKMAMKARMMPRS